MTVTEARKIPYSIRIELIDWYMTLCRVCQYEEMLPDYQERLSTLKQSLR